MAGITSAIENLISAIIGIFSNILQSILAVFQSIFAVFQTILVSVFELAKNVVEFLLSNIVVIAIVAAVFFGYTAYTNRTGSAKPVLKKN